MRDIVAIYRAGLAWRIAAGLASIMPSLTRLSTLAVLGALALSTGPESDSLMGPGVSHELASMRSKQISAVRYAMNLSVVSADTARGSVVIRFRAKEQSDVI